MADGTVEPDALIAPPVGAAPRRQPPFNPERTARDILVAAREEFCEYGFEGARIDRIAARAAANKRLLYHYFGNKEALYSAVLLDAYREIRRGERASCTSGVIIKLRGTARVLRRTMACSGRRLRYWGLSGAHAGLGGFP